MTIPNAEHSVVSTRKLRDYCLNPMYDVRANIKRTWL